MRECSMVLADLAADPPAGGTQVSRYATGRNLSGTHENEVVRTVVRPGRLESEYEVIIRGLSRAKTEAIVMILNAPEV